MVEPMLAPAIGRNREDGPEGAIGAALVELTSVLAVVVLIKV